jgi:hypothetical protein
MSTIPRFTAPRFGSDTITPAKESDQQTSNASAAPSVSTRQNSGVDTAIPSGQSGDSFVSAASVTPSQAEPKADQPVEANLSQQSSQSTLPPVVATPADAPIGWKPNSGITVLEITEPSNVSGVSKVVELVQEQSSPATSSSPAASSVLSSNNQSTVTSGTIVAPPKSVKFDDKMQVFTPSPTSSSTTESVDSATPAKDTPLSTTPQSPASSNQTKKDDEQGWFGWAFSVVTAPIRWIWNGITGLFSWLGSLFGGGDDKKQKAA